jgi:hypothetical protein
MRIESNELVQKPDGTLAYRMQFKCRTKDCANYNKVTKTTYDPVKPVVETEEES